MIIDSSYTHVLEEYVGRSKELQKAEKELGVLMDVIRKHNPDPMDRSIFKSSNIYKMKEFKNFQNIKFFKCFSSCHVVIVAPDQQSYLVKSFYIDV